MYLVLRDLLLVVHHPSHLILSCLCMPTRLLVLFLYLYLAVLLMFPYSIACVADPSRSLNPKLFPMFPLALLYYSLVSYLLPLTHVYHMTPYMLSLDPLTCHHLVRPSGYVMIDPVNY